jgi:hypothetical protein
MKKMTKNNNPKNQLSESLYEGDLKWLVYDEVMIDMHKTKLGEDKDYIVLAIPIKDSKPANDLANFIEHGIAEFEDVEVSPATDDQGRYLIYVEIKRGPESFKSIQTILTDCKQLSDIHEWRFQTSKQPEAVEFTPENFAKLVVVDPAVYGRAPEEIEAEQTAESIKARYKFLLNY